MQKIIHWFMKDKKIIFYAFTCGLLTTICLSLYSSKSFAEEIQNGIAKEVIRFHVKANSDSEADQSLKILVKDKVLERFHKGLSTAENLDDTRTFISKNLDNIQAYVETIVREQGYGYEVSASLCKDFFPTKTYGDISFPAGQYEALRIDIGAAKGTNWWCCMFPPLCFVDVTQKELPVNEKLQLKNIMTDDEYDLLTNYSNKDVSVKVKFKIVEFWQEFKASKTEYAVIRANKNISPNNY